MSAYELFKMFGVSKRCYEEFLKPTLLVSLFAPPEQISAASMLETLYFYALGHQNSFDVCWCKGTISELILQPLVERIRAAGGRVLGNCLVTEVLMDKAGRVNQVVATDRTTGVFGWEGGAGSCGRVIIYCNILFFSFRHQVFFSFRHQVFSSCLAVFYLPPTVAVFNSSSLAVFLSLLQSITPTTANKQTQTQRSEGGVTSFPLLFIITLYCPKLYAISYY